MCMGCFLCKSVCRENTVVPEMCFDSKPFVKKILLLRLRRICLQLCFSRKCCGAYAVFLVANPFCGKILLCLRRFCVLANPFFKKILVCMRRFFVKPFFDKLQIRFSSNFICDRTFLQIRFSRKYCCARAVFFANPFFKKIRMCLHLFLLQPRYSRRYCCACAVLLQTRFQKISVSRKYCRACAVICFQNCYSRKCCRAWAVFCCKSAFRTDTAVPAPFFVCKAVIRETAVVPEPVFSRKYCCACAVLLAIPFFEKTIFYLRCFCCKSVFRENSVLPAPLLLQICFSR